jgi:hypothetical protein
LRQKDREGVVDDEHRHDQADRPEDEQDERELIRHGGRVVGQCQPALLAADHARPVAHGFSQRPQQLRPGDTGLRRDGDLVGAGDAGEGLQVVWGQADHRGPGYELRHPEIHQAGDPVPVSNGFGIQDCYLIADGVPQVRGRLLVQQGFPRAAGEGAFEVEGAQPGRSAGGDGDADAAEVGDRAALAVQQRQWCDRADVQFVHGGQSFDLVHLRLCEPVGRGHHGIGVPGHAGEGIEVALAHGVAEDEAT